MNQNTNVIDILSRLKEKSDIGENDIIFKFGITDNDKESAQYLLDLIKTKAKLFYPNVDINHVMKIAAVSLQTAFNLMKQYNAELYICKQNASDEMNILTYYDEAINLALFTLVNYIKDHKDEFYDTKNNQSAQN